MRKLSLIALAAVAFLGITGSANAATPMLETGDFVGISFWLVSMGMIATTVFFFAERGTVAASWRTSISVAGLCLLYTSPSPRDVEESRMPSSA